MRTTITLDNDIYKIVRNMAESSGMSLGKTISLLVRRSLTDRLQYENHESGPPIFSVSEHAPLFGPEDVAKGEDEW